MKLQFGHGRVAVEICMEEAGDPAAVKLQFGHGRVAVEIRRPRRRW